MAVQYKILDRNIIKYERNAPFFQERTLHEASWGDVTEIGHSMDGDSITILLKDDVGNVIFDIMRDELYPPGRKNPQMCRFHRDFLSVFMAPVATDKVFSTVDLYQLAPKVYA